MKRSHAIRLLGTVDTEPQIITFDNGNKLAKVSLLSKDKKKDANGNYFIQKTVHCLTMWNKGAELIETYVKNKDKLSIEGFIYFNKYIDKQNNETIRQEVSIKTFSMLGPKKEACLSLSVAV